ncbi:hypothetical protein HQ590_10055, partial [bacterium]|nr:hypothetical protein [bacterium]
IQNARAAEIVQQLQQIIQQAEQLGGPTAAPGRPRVPTVRRRSTPPAPAPKGAVMIEGKVIITADERTNKIFVLSRPANFEFFDNLVAELDAQVEPDVITRVVALDYANAEELASQLNALITGGTLSLRSRTSTRPGAPPPPPTPAAAVSGAGGAGAAGFLEYSEGVRILPDPRTNSLLLLASRQDIERLEQLIKSIDTAVAQVLIEVVIAEVKLDNTLDVGVEMVKRMFKEGQVIQTGSTGAGVPGQPPADLGSLYPDTELLGGLAEDAAPLALAAASGGLTHFLTFKNLKLDAVIRLMSTSSKFKVLSTPIIQTLHNQEASIIVGESRPVITSTVSDINSSDSTAVRSSVEYKDIAIELTVTPRINPDGYVTMDIEQKINDFGGNIKVNGVDVPIITKREAKSAVTVKTDSTIVLGGMIREDRGLTESKVPFLGDLPLFGLLFKDKSATKNRTELIVFIRPRVLRNDDEAVAEARLRSERLKAGAELELERMFEEPGAEPGAQLGTEDPAAGPSESTESARTAKVKALQETTKKPNQP